MHPELRNASTIDGEVCLPIEPGRIDDAVRSVGMLVKRDRPASRQRLMRFPVHIGRNSHPDRALFPEVDQMQRVFRLDVGIEPLSECGFVERKAPNYPIALIAQNRFKEADGQRLSEVDHAKAVGRVPPTRVAKPARRFAKAEGARMGVEIDAPETFAGAEDVYLERRRRERGRRLGTRHLREVALCNALGNLERLRTAATLQSLTPCQTFETALRLNQKSVKRPKSAKPLLKRLQLGIRFAFRAELPLWKSEPTLRPVEAK